MKYFHNYLCRQLKGGGMETKMKIGILTFHRAINYGAFMQSYSLLSKLQNDFPEDEVEIIDYNNKEREFFIKKCPIVFLYRRSIKEGIYKYVQTREFKKALKFLKRSTSFLSVADEKIEEFMSQTYDLIIVGSDAVFNWNDIGLPNPYFLANTKCLYKMSYAASSHLQKYNMITLKEKEYLFRALQEFQFLGVRDDSTKNFVDKILDTNKGEHTCDPSIFLELNFSEMNLKKKLSKHHFCIEKKTVFVMLMHPEYAKYVREYFGEECQIVALMDGNKYADIYLYDLNPFEWAHVFKYGDCLVTDYFHGTIFGLKNGIPVMSIDASKYDGEYESKACDLLIKRLKLPRLYVNAKELDGKKGKEIFNDKIRNILETFEKEEVLNALKKEGESYNIFRDGLMNMEIENV